MSDDIPLTPVITRTKISSRLSTPKSAKKRTILNKTFDESYIEEEDETYVYNETVGADDDDEDIDDDEVDDYLVDDDDKADEELDTDVESDVEAKGDDGKIEIIPSNQQIGKIRQFIIKHEVIRKALHSSIGLLTVWLYSLGVNQRQIILPASILFIIIFTNDYIRFQNPEINKVVVQNFWFIVRENEIDHYNGVLYYIAGLLIVFSILPKDVSFMSVLLVSWADTAASTFGRQFGKYTFQITKGKSFAGALASFLTGVFSCYLVYGYLIPHYNYVNKPEEIFWKPDTSSLPLNVFAMLCGVIASFSEFVNLFKLDDNFTIPVLSGFLIYGLIWSCQI